MRNLLIPFHEHNLHLFVRVLHAKGCEQSTVTVACQPADPSEE